MCLFRNGLSFFLDGKCHFSISHRPVRKSEGIESNPAFLCTFLFVCLFIVSFSFFANLLQPLVGAASRVQSLNSKSEKSRMNFFEVWRSPRLSQTNVVPISFFRQRWKKKQSVTFFVQKGEIWRWESVCSVVRSPPGVCPRHCLLLHVCSPGDCSVQ